MVDTNLAYRVIGWDESHETPQSLKKQGQRADVLLPSNLGTTAIQALMRSPEGPAMVGVWYIVQMLAANASRRGVLCEQGSPLTARQLANVTGWEVSFIERALTVLCQPDTRYLERVPLDVALQPPILPEPKPRAPRKPKPLPSTHCPVCDADLEAWANGEGCLCGTEAARASRPCFERQHVSNSNECNPNLGLEAQATPVADAASVREMLNTSKSNQPLINLAPATSLGAGKDDSNRAVDGKPIPEPETLTAMSEGGSQPPDELTRSWTLAASATATRASSPCPTARVAESEMEVAPGHVLETEATEDRPNSISELLAQARSLVYDDDDGCDLDSQVPHYDDQGRRIELRNLSELIRRLETGQVDTPVLENYLESRSNRDGRQGEDQVTAPPANKSPPSKIPR